MRKTESRLRSFSQQIDEITNKTNKPSSFVASSTTHTKSQGGKKEKERRRATQPPGQPWSESPYPSHRAMIKIYEGHSALHQCLAQDLKDLVSRFHPGLPIQPDKARRQQLSPTELFMDYG